MDRVAANHRVSVASIAVAWLAARPTVVAPLASARSPEQVSELMASVGIELQSDEVALLDEASAE